VDIYRDNAVVHIFNPLSQTVITGLEEALRKALNIQGFFYKKNSREDFILPPGPPTKIVIEEYGRRFLVNLSDYLDTGLFLDHRETRQWIAGQSSGKTLLNTFAYAGSFTVCAALAGAQKTCSVDISAVYCQWIKDNLALNNLPPEKNWVYKMDTLEFLSYAKRKKLVFDIIILDPPTFSKNKGKSFSVQKDHPSLINRALEVLAPSGFIFFSNNFQEFRMAARDLPHCEITEKTDTIPPDFAGTRPHQAYIIKSEF
jgi:23S rRNA (cytosine1962-C5)-methyltransferase